MTIRIPSRLILIHPKTGGTFIARKGEGEVARTMILAGYNPIGPKGQAQAERIRAAAGNA